MEDILRHAQEVVGHGLHCTMNLELRTLHPGDYPALLHYLQQLSPQTASRFGPHAFTTEGVASAYSQPGDVHSGYIAVEPQSQQIVAYAIVRHGYLEHDSPRLRGYGLLLDHQTDYTLAPSVADAWQGRGVGSALWRYVLASVRQAGARRVILWGGVQASNHQALRYYAKHGFRVLGQFEHHGSNYDMLLEVE